MRLLRSFGWSLLCALLVHGAHAAGGPAYRVADLDAGPPYATGVYPSTLTVFDGRLYFAGYTATAGREPWVSDGTAAGTEVLADLCAGRCWSVGAYPEVFVPLDGHLYFPACEAAACRFWRTGGDALEPVFEGMVVQILPWQGALYYSTAEGEVYRTDGTGPGTRLLRAGEELTPLLLIPADDELFVFAVDYTFTLTPRPPQLWRTDGTPENSGLVLEDPRLEVFPLTFDGEAVYRIDGPLRLTDGFSSRPLLPDPPFFGAVPLYVIDGVLIVQSAGPELWRTDGTSAGTVLLAAGDEAAEGFVARTAVFQGEVYFVFGLRSQALMRTVDLAGATTVHEFADPIKDLRVVDGSLYVATGPGSFAPPRSLWRIDGLAAAPAPVFTPDEGSFSELTAFGGELYFRRSLAAGGELARVGAEGEVEPLTRLPFDPSANPRHLTRHRDRIVFETEDFRKWVSDGTSRGTFELQATYDPFDVGSSRRFVSVGEEAVLQGSRDFLTVDEGGDVVPIFERLTGSERVVPGAIFALEPGIFFFSFDQAGSVDLWRGDRDSGAIERVIGDLQVLANPFEPLRFAARGGALVLLEGSAWWTDGTAGGTRRILDVLETCDCLLVNPVAAGSAFFFASRPNPRTEDPAWRLWRSDGTAAGTAPLREIEPYDAARGISLRDLVAAGERAFFVVTDGLSREELWTSDGTPAGTLLLHDPGWTAPLELTAFDGRLLFTADDRVHGRELWTSDGTAAGTELFLDLFPGRRSSSPRHLTVIDGRLVFMADEGVHGAEPWVSDGTRAGTRLLQDVLPGLPPSDPESFTAAGELVYFNAGDEETGFELWAMARAALAGELAAVFTAAPERSVQGKPVVFTDHSSGRPESWCWRFGDEPVEEPECGATTPEARHAYRQPGVYTVTLRVERTLPEGGTESSTASAEVEAVAFCKPCLLE